MTIAKKLVRYSRLSREKQIPGEVATLRESFCAYLPVAAEPRCRKIDGVVCRRAPRNLSQNE